MVVVPTLVLLALAAVWTGFWFYAASVAGSTLAAWQEREERIGRSFHCGSQTVGGYPFRIEVRCENASASWSNASPPLQIRARDMLAVAQVYQPTLLIAEFGAPLTVAVSGSPVAFTGDWTLAQASLRGVPSSPERVSTAVDNLKISRPDTTGPMFSARHLELHARLDPASIPERPVIDLAVRLDQAAVKSVVPALDQPLDAEVAAVLQGLKDLNPEPMAAWLRDLQRAGGVLQVVKARIAYGTMVASGNGTLALSPLGRLDGVIDLTIAGLDVRLLERLVPELKGNAAMLGAGLLALLGKPAELEGRPAVVMPLRFADGAVTLGPLPLGRTPALF